MAALWKLCTCTYMVDYIIIRRNVKRRPGCLLRCKSECKSVISENCNVSECLTMRVSLLLKTKNM